MKRFLSYLFFVFFSLTCLNSCSTTETQQKFPMGTYISNDPTEIKAWWNRPKYSIRFEKNVKPRLFFDGASEKYKMEGDKIVSKLKQEINYDASKNIVYIDHKDYTLSENEDWVEFCNTRIFRIIFLEVIAIVAVYFMRFHVKVIS